MAQKSILEQALLQVQTLEEAVKANAKGILASTMKEELNSLLKEQEDEKDPDEEGKDVTDAPVDDVTSDKGEDEAPSDTEELPGEEAGEEIPSEDEPEFVEVNAEVPKQWQEYLIDSAIYGPLGLLSTTKYVTFMVYKNGDVFFTDASNPKNIYPLDQAPEAVKNMFYEIENDLLDKAAYQWGSEFRQQ